MKIESSPVLCDTPEEAILDARKLVAYINDNRDDYNGRIVDDLDAYAMSPQGIEWDKP